MQLRTRVGLNIQEMRRERGWSQEALAHAADVDRGYLGKLENGKYAVSLDTLEKIATALGIDPVELLQPREQITP
ncbi:MAG: helix-turn-helix domain-containing protein [Shimia sp.]